MQTAFWNDGAGDYTNALRRAGPARAALFDRCSIKSVSEMEMIGPARSRRAAEKHYSGACMPPGIGGLGFRRGVFSSSAASAGFLFQYTSRR
jgi:hypothetical protein